MYSAADLPLNTRGAVYHLDLLPEELADVIITVGDPGRVFQVSQYFDSIEVTRSHREFQTHTGFIGKQRVSVISTGIGIPNIDIVLTELDALKNVDLEARQLLSQTKQLDIIRLGTTGALHRDINIGDCIQSKYSIGFDTLIHYYENDNRQNNKVFEQELKAHLNEEIPAFYITKSNLSLSQSFKEFTLDGITATCGGFYGPQGRINRMALKYPSFIDDLSTFEFDNCRITNLEMETAAILGLGEILGHRCTSLSVVLANRKSHTFCESVDEHVRFLIESSIPVIENLGQQ
tara:strand:+ start:324 stop:1196 length:873 start_codon:yes stop_codon:yes gene_type:complete